MKKISLIISIILTMTFSIFGANLNGTVKVEDSDSLGVFVYAEGEKRYDITDSKGKFVITGLKMGGEYTLILQKGSLPDYKKKVKISAETTSVEILIPSEKSSVKETVKTEVKETTEKEVHGAQKETSNSVKDTKVVHKDITNKENIKIDTKENLEDNKATKVSKVDVEGIVNSVMPGDIFLQISGEANGIIMKANSTFKLQLKPGAYKTTLIQDGSVTKKTTINVGKMTTELEPITMEPLDYNSLTLRLTDKIENGVVQLFKDGYLEYSSKITKYINKVYIKGLKRGQYKLVVKAYGKTDFESEIKVDGDNNLDIKFLELGKENKLFVNLYPKDIEVEVRVLEEGQLIKSIMAKDLAIVEALDVNKTYTLEIVNPKYKKVEMKRVLAGDKVEVSLVREVKGTLVNGFVSPFNSGAKVMLLDKGVILGETVSDENGYYEMEFTEALNGDKVIRVSGENFKEESLPTKFDSNKSVYENNVMLKPYNTKVNGITTFGKNEILSNVLVLIENLGIWQFTNEKGEYYFNNLPEGEYELTYKKLGYTSKKEKVKATKDETSIKNIILNPIGKLVFRSNIEAYKLIINGNEINVNQKMYEYIQGMGVINIVASKNNYLPINVKIKLTEAGEIRDVFLDFINIEEQNAEVKNKIEKIKTYIKDLKITESEELLDELGQIKPLKAYEKDYLDIKSKLSTAKLKLFDIDRSIKFEIEKVKDNIKKDESSKLGYVEKNKNLNKLYKESLDYLEKIILSHPYTTYRYDIHILQSDIFTKMGMPNSSKNSIEEAKKYENRRKE